MNREPWVVYAVVLVVVVAMMYGKYLIANGDDDNKDKEDK